MSGREWSDSETEQLKALHAQGLTMTAIARSMGRASGTIAGRARRLGLSWDRTKTGPAVQARVDRAKELRAQLQVGMLEDAQRMRASMFAPTKVFNFGGKDNTYNERTVPEPPHQDKARLYQAIGIAVDRSVRIAEFDSAAAVDTQKSVLAQLGRAFGLGVKQASDDGNADAGE